MNIHPFLSFNGYCEEAAYFYANALGGEVGPIYRYGSCAAPGEDPDMVQYTDLSVGDKRLIQMSDCGKITPFAGFFVSLDVLTIEQAEACFNSLSKGGSITLPFAPSHFSPGFGMLVDKFGVSWMIHVVQLEDANA